MKKILTPLQEYYKELSLNQENELVTLFRHTYGAQREKMGFWKGYSMGLMFMLLTILVYYFIGRNV